MSVRKPWPPTPDKAENRKDCNIVEIKEVGRCSHDSSHVAGNGQSGEFRTDYQIL